MFNLVSEEVSLRQGFRLTKMNMMGLYVQTCSHYHKKKSHRPAIRDLFTESTQEVCLLVKRRLTWSDKTLFVTFFLKISMQRERKKSRPNIARDGDGSVLSARTAGF